MTRAHRSRAGFTLVEVMLAIGIMTVGSLGILAMHNAVTRANRDARDMNMALAITETWIERVERDALLWSQPGPNTDELLSTNYLNDIANQQDETIWFKPEVVRVPNMPADMNENQSYGFDFFGQDTGDPDAVKYCVNLRLSWVRRGSSARVDVRTYWLREGPGFEAPASNNWVLARDFRTSNCEAGDADGWNLGAAPNVNVIYASTIVTWLRRDPP